MDQDKRNIVTEDDVLKGSKTLFVQNREGEITEITLTALSWRQVMTAGELNGVGDMSAYVLENSLRIPNQAEREAILNKLTPISLGMLLAAATALYMGVDALKKNRAVLQEIQAQTNPAPVPIPEPRDGEISGRPSASSSRRDMPEPTFPSGAQPS